MPRFKNRGRHPVGVRDARFTRLISRGILRLKADAVQVFLPVVVFNFRGAEVDAIAADGQRGKAFVAELIFADQLELFGVGFEDERGAVFDGLIDHISDRNGRSGDGAADPLFPHFRPVAGPPAEADAPVVDAVDVAVDGDQRLLVARLPVLPEGARTVAVDADDFRLGKAAAGEDEVLAPDGGSAGGHRGAGRCPEFFAGLGIVRGHPVAAGEQKLIPPVDVRHRRRREAVTFGPIRPPNEFAVFAVISHEMPALFIVGRHDHEGAIKARRRGITVGVTFGDIRPDDFFPDFFAFEVQSQERHLVVVMKRREQAFSIRGDGRAGVGVFAVLRGKAALVDVGLPEEFPRRSVQSDDALDLVFFIGRGKVNPAADDGGRRMPPAGDRHFPDHVLSFRPFDRDVLRSLGEAVAARPPPPGPIARSGRRFEKRLRGRTAQANEREDQGRSDHDFLLE